MRSAIGKPATLVVTLVFITAICAGCGKSSDGPALKDLPIYPNATEGEAMSQSVPGGFVGGALAQYATTDSYDAVLDFYTDALSRYTPQELSNTSELGRQTAFSIPKDKGMISVAIQELTQEGVVSITFMSVGR